MTQLILSIILMYAVVGGGAYWGLKKRQQLQLEQLHADGTDREV